MITVEVLSLSNFSIVSVRYLAEHLLWSEFSEMVRIRTILQISVRIRSEFAQKVRIFQFLSLSLPKNLEKEALA